MKLLKHCLPLAMALCVSMMCLAQDIIIKQDKTEIKSKVSEITETTIKYKKWDNVDGPLYNISKTEVFMILYSNGQREIINQSQTLASTTAQQTAARNNAAMQSTVAQTTKIDTAVDYRKLKVKYAPSRINIGLQQPLSIGTDVEFRIIKNCFNIGVTYNYLFPKDDYILTSNFGFLYGSLYLPLNRVIGNYEKQNKGLFVFAHAGYGMTSAQIKDFYTGKSAYVNSGGFTWRFGADYYITKGFGITVSSFEFKNAYAGIVFNL